MARLAGCCHRFIPTPVGNTRCAALHDGRPTVHPHACGEHRIGTAADRAVSGSSPRLWGTHHIADVRHGKHRFIPTPVGNTLPLLRQLIAQAVHPHACGEHRASQRRRHQTGGSSPRLWGTRNHAPAAVPADRFIPTPVGNTSAASTSNTCSYGSSPRLWGTQRED